MGGLHRLSHHVQTLYRAKLEEGLAPKSVKHIHTTLHRALKQAVRWGLVPHNVAASVDPPRVVTPEMRPLSPTQARKLLAAAGNRLEALYFLAVTTVCGRASSSAKAGRTRTSKRGSCG